MNPPLNTLFAASQYSKSILIRYKPAKLEYIITGRNWSGSWWGLLSGQLSIHDRTFSQVSDERIRAARQLGTLFEVCPDRKQAFEDLLRLCSDRDSEVREEAINSLTTVFPNVLEKEMAWERFVNLTAYPVERIMKTAVNSLIIVFPLMPDKSKAWKDLVGLINSKSSLEDVSRGIVYLLPNIVSEFQDKGQVWKDLLEMTVSEDPYVREKAASLLSIVFPGLPEEKKGKAWEDLIELTGEAGDIQFLEQVAKALGKIFPFLPDKKKDEALEEILQLAGKSVDEAVQNEIMFPLLSVFSLVPDKKRAWDNILRLTEDEKGTVRKQAVDILVSIFPEMQDKIRVWSDFLKLTGEWDRYGRDTAADALVSVFPYLEDKDAAWKELMGLAGNEDEYIQRMATDTLSKVFPHVSDKSQAYSDFVSLAEKKDSYVLRKVVKTLASIYSQYYEEHGTNEEKTEIREMKEKDRLEEKEEVESEGFYKPASGNASSVRGVSANSLEATLSEEEKGKKKGVMGEVEVKDKNYLESEQVKEKESKKSTFDFLRQRRDKGENIEKNTADSFIREDSEIPEKERIIEELLRLSSDPDPQVRRSAIESLVVLYLQKSGKQQDIWHELLKMSEDTDTGVRKGTASLLSYVFPAIEEKSAVFFDLVRLTESQDAQLRKKAAELLATAFKYSDDKQKAWNDLLMLTSAGDREVRKGAILALSSGYSEVPDKRKAWTDLMRLSNHSDSFVQRVVARSLGSAFFYMPDKTEAWRDMKGLIDSPYVYVRRYSLRSLGRASLWRALRAENEATYLFGLKEAIKYFKKAAETSVDIAVPEFYYPFYEALLQILFNERPFRRESEWYLSEVTGEIMELEEDQRLIKAVEELTELLREAEDLTPGDLLAQKKLLEACIGAFDRASGLFDSMEEDAIVAQKTHKKEYKNVGNMVLEQKLKQILSGIRYKAKTACLQAKGRPAEKIICTVNQKVSKWSFQNLEKDRKELDRQLESLLNILKIEIPYTPENTHIFGKIEDIRQEQDLLERYRQVGRFIGLLLGVKMP
jgi:HEAT repeat protein